jgi:glutathione S-transferase
LLARERSGVSAERQFFAGPGYSIADIAMFGYLHVGDEAGYDLADYPSLTGWLARVERQPGFIDDLEPYPENARPGRGRSTYD